MRKKDWIISAIIIAVLYSGFLFYNYKSTSYGFEYNPEREKLGIPLIESGWKAHKDSISWVNPSNKVPNHSWKKLEIRSAMLEIERDDFILNENGQTVRLICYYHYDAHCYNIYRESLSAPDKAISCDEANKLLIENGMPPLKQCKPCEKEAGR